jgi:hypothetical protein
MYLKVTEIGKKVTFFDFKHVFSELYWIKGNFLKTFCIWAPFTDSFGGK